MGKAHEETRCIMLTGPRDRSPGTPHRATWENTRVVRRQKTGVKGKLGHGLYSGFLGKGKAGQSEWFRIG